MPSKELFHVGQKYLNKANFYVTLESNLAAASYPEKLVLGPTESEDRGEDGEKLKFSKRALILPSSSFFTLTKAVNKAVNSFAANEETEWSMLIFRHSKIHEVFAEYQIYEGAPVFKFLIKWHFSRDTRFLKMCQDGANEVSDMSNLEGRETVFLRRGAYLNKESCEILVAHLATLLEFCYFENSALKKMTLDFVDFVVSDGKLKTYVESKLPEFDSMKYQSKVKIVKHLLSALFEQKNMNQEDQDFGMKKYYDCLSNKVNLVFSLFNLHLK